MAELKHRTGVVAEIGRREPGQWCSKIGKRAENRFAVLHTGSDKKIDIFRGSRLRVETNRPPSDDEILNPVCVQRE
jgi:hypothetical protein